MKVVKVWRCAACWKTYTNKDSASFCCEPEIDSYECSECMKQFPEEWIAEACCVEGSGEKFFQTSNESSEGA